MEAEAVLMVDRSHSMALDWNRRNILLLLRIIFAYSYLANLGLLKPDGGGAGGASVGLTTA